MLYLLWALLNICLFVFFLVICFRATRLIREKFGLLTSIFFVFGLLSFVGSSNNDKANIEPNSNQTRTWNFTSADSLSRNGSSFIDVDLEKTLISKYDLLIKCSVDKQGKQVVPVSATSSTTGFVSGTNWIPSAITVNQADDNDKLEYVVRGTVEWKLLGASVYSQAKEYKGVVSTK